MLEHIIHFRGGLAFFSDPEDRLVMFGIRGDQLLADDHFGDPAAIEGIKIGILEIVALDAGREVDQADIQEQELGGFPAVGDEGDCGPICSANRLVASECPF